MAVNRHVSRATCRIEPRYQPTQKGTRLSHGKRPIAGTDGFGHRYGEGGETMEPYKLTPYGVLIGGVEYATYQDYLDTRVSDDVTNADSDD